MHWWISFSIARDWLPPLLKCLAIWLRFDPIFPYSLTSFLRSFMSATTSIWWLICFSSRSFLRYSDQLIDKQAAPWSNKSSSTSVRRNPIKCLWFSSLSLFFVLILLLPLRLFLPPGVHVFQYRLSLLILEIVLWTPLGGTNRQVKRLLLRGYGEIPIKINPIGEQDAKRHYC